MYTFYLWLGKKKTGLIFYHLTYGYIFNVSSPGQFFDRLFPYTAAGYIIQYHKPVKSKMALEILYRSEAQLVKIAAIVIRNIIILLYVTRFSWMRSHTAHHRENHNQRRYPTTIIIACIITAGPPVRIPATRFIEDITSIYHRSCNIHIYYCIVSFLL